MNGLQPRERPRIVESKSHKVATGCGNMYIHISHDDIGILEVFANLGKSGQCGAAQTEAICRLCSIALRSGIDPNSIVKQLKGIQCPNPVMFPRDEKVLSCADAIAYALGKEIETYKGEQVSEEK